MAPIRAARAHPSRSYDDGGSESGDDTEPESTPQPKSGRTASKRRVSEFVEPDAADSSRASDGSRAPLQTVNINDDAAEKRRRRKSAKVTALVEEHGDQAQAGPSNEAAGAEPPVAPGRLQRLQSVAKVPVAETLLNPNPNHFEELIKLAADNKINPTNSWNFTLIDYFHDLSLLRNSVDNSINFQRASSTLDGCVKIWTSRVDSAGTETGKLLSNLVQEGRITAEDEDGANSDNPDGELGSQARARRKRGSASTLAKDPAQLKSKKLEVEFSVDPLFRKTCADFDEGGAQGLLMSHLALSITPEGGMRMIFDASDAVPKTVEEEEQADEPEEDVDLSYLRSAFLPDLDTLDEKAISHSLAGFSFSKDAVFEDSVFRNLGLDDDESEHGDAGIPAADASMNFDDAAAPAEDFFVGDQAVGEGFGGGMDEYGTPPFDDGDNASVGAAADERGGAQGPAAFVPFDPRKEPNQKDLVMAMTEGEGGMFDYFDQTFLKNWAGPEHWKLRRIVRKPEVGTDAAPKARREKKEAFRIDFLTPAEKDFKEVTTELFAPVKRGAGINLPGTSKSRKGKGKAAAAARDRDLHLLPDDMHFSSRHLVTLFLKPQFALRMRGQRAPLEVNAEGELDEDFWAQQNAAAAQQQDPDADDSGAMPFNTQFFHDDFDDAGGFDDAFDGEGDGIGSAAAQEPEEQDLLAATQGQTRRVRPEFVNYAKRAKRVDVRKLKENIWKNLDIVVPEPKTEDDMDEDEANDENATDPSDARQFSDVVSGLRSVYVKDKMDEISTSFCFICLLHLANERGLKLEGGEDGVVSSLDDGDAMATPAVNTTDKGVGDIWSLKVFRDPNATPAA